MTSSQVEVILSSLRDMCQSRLEELDSEFQHNLAWLAKTTERTRKALAVNPLNIGLVSAGPTRARKVISKTGQNTSSQDKRRQLNRRRRSSPRTRKAQDENKENSVLVNVTNNPERLLRRNRSRALRPDKSRTTPTMVGPQSFEKGQDSVMIVDEALGCRETRSPSTAKSPCTTEYKEDTPIEAVPEEVVDHSEQANGKRDHQMEWTGSCQANQVLSPELETRVSRTSEDLAETQEIPKSSIRESPKSPMLSETGGRKPVPRKSRSLRSNSAGREEVVPKKLLPENRKESEISEPKKGSTSSNPPKRGSSRGRKRSSSAMEAGQREPGKMSLQKSSVAFDVDENGGISVAGLGALAGLDLKNSEGKSIKPIEGPAKKIRLAKVASNIYVNRLGAEKLVEQKAEYATEEKQTDAQDSHPVEISKEKNRWSEAKMQDEGTTSGERKGEQTHRETPVVAEDEVQSPHLETSQDNRQTVSEVVAERSGERDEDENFDGSISRAAPSTLESGTAHNNTDSGQGTGGVNDCSRTLGEVSERKSCDVTETQRSNEERGESTPTRVLDFEAEADDHEGHEGSPSVKTPSRLANLVTTMTSFLPVLGGSNNPQDGATSSETEKLEMATTKRKELEKREEELAEKRKAAAAAKMREHEERQKRAEMKRRKLAELVKQKELERRKKEEERHKRLKEQELAKKKQREDEEVRREERRKRIEEHKRKLAEQEEARRRELELRLASSKYEASMAQARDAALMPPPKSIPSKHTPQAKNKATEEELSSYQMTTEKNDNDEDSTDEESSTRNNKKIPVWARQPHLNRALEDQDKALRDPDTIFPRTSATCDLEEVFAEEKKKKKRYRTRGSSSNWVRDRLTWKEEMDYKKAVGLM
ncbi:hypothetical protein NDN08_004826 [Rhodosorus marinus]|uniref:Inner centromere protein ARK-binding domain-containing protein n=1 Tax=Rhodosorus marinus TaxID=101924 RepID=A0AAV8UMG2_9RHOD|nr:hypothetical protein NDN08_004826 [Rhodosorus marinus]